MAEQMDTERGFYRNGKITVEQATDGMYLVQRPTTRPRKGSSNGRMAFPGDPETVYETAVFDDAVEHARSLAKAG
ncbi:hypothetical protein [Guyparkeria sp.]|uniref:hypothetical protein n=1 Tax=Guyparkeria sp. TaxID=2035736 RepID=UPI0035698219